MAKRQKKKTVDSDATTWTDAQRDAQSASAKIRAEWWALSKEGERELQERKWHRYLASEAGKRA